MKEINGCDKTSISALRDFQKEIGIIFEREELLITAFTHSSYVNDNAWKSIQDYERLEFLGDAVLQITVSRFLYDKFPEIPEGELSKLRAAAVCEPSLAEIASDLNFGDLMILGKGEEKFGGRNRASILADMFEAFLGAVYLDKGIDEVNSFLEKVMFGKIKDGDFSQVIDYKTELQEFIQKDHAGILSYEITSEEGPSHNKVFVADVLLDGKVIGNGSGKSKKEAEKMAAKNAYIDLT